MAKRVYYSGSVQGVGFRATAVRVASGHAVRGWVRNLSDGGVELFADGAPAAVDAFLRDLRNRMSGHIDGEEATEAEADESLTGFRVRY
jgi:acylphosphatase